MKNKDISTLIGPIVKGFRKYNLTIFIVVLTTGLAVAVLMLNATLQQSSDTTGYTAATNPTNFDQATIDRVKQLHTSSDTLAPVVLPSNRINPFAE
ncbi:MAG: hypothetical protein JWN26_312 [Candidatus Saccharibacteria bacterium]|nr:hypothetical protein [Candidatus Saccharibacteria bacterium]